MQLHSFERRSSYIFFAIPNQTHELFFAPPGIYIYISFYLIVVNRNNVMPLAVAYISELCRITRDELFMREKSLQIADIACSKSDSL